MLRERYQFKIAEDGATFLFESFGPKGVVMKVVKYSRTGVWKGYNMYNLGFGDRNGESDDVDDSIITNNGDRDKVLATVAATVLEFTERRKDSVIIARGTNRARTRLYQMSIRANFTEIEKFFTMFGFHRGQLLPFEAGINYEGFWVVKKLL